MGEMMIAEEISIRGGGDENTVTEIAGWKRRGMVERGKRA
jgi:hypothetical protein